MASPQEMYGQIEKLHNFQALALTEALLFPSCAAFDELHDDIKIFIVGLSHQKLLWENGPPGECKPTLDVINNLISLACSEIRSYSWKFAYE